MSFEVSFERGAGRSLSPRIPGAAKAPKRPSPAKPAAQGKAPSPAKPAAQVRATMANYWETLGTVEASVMNPPPCEHGTNADDRAWLEQNAREPEVVTLPCGMQYKVLGKGRGTARSPKLNSPCLCHYRGFLIDGTEFDSSYDRYESCTSNPRVQPHLCCKRRFNSLAHPLRCDPLCASGQPFEFVPASMIQGWTVALQLMSEGDTWELYVPAEMAYGDAGRSSEARGQYIPAGACLVFVLTLIKIKGPARPQPKRPPPGSIAAVPKSKGKLTAAASSVEAAGGTVEGRAELSASATLAAPPVLPAAEGVTKPSTAEPAASSNSWLGGLFERPTLAESARAREALESVASVEGSAAPGGLAAPSSAPEEVDEHCAAKLAEQRASLEQSALETVQEILSQLRLPTLKQALGDLGMPIDGGKAALTQRLAQRLALSYRAE